MWWEEMNDLYYSLKVKFIGLDGRIGKKSIVSIVMQVLYDMLHDSFWDYYVKNTLLDSVRESEDGMIWENSTEACTFSV